jgi:cytochrome P450
MQDPAVWSDAVDFIPERWLGEYKGAEIHRTCPLPFVLAPEIALVNSRSFVTVGEIIFAMKEMRLILATLVRRYEATLVPGQPHRRFWKIVPVLKQGFYDVGIRPRV